MTNWLVRNVFAVRPGVSVPPLDTTPASEGTVSFTGDTFTLKPTKGTYRFTEGRSKKRERPMTRDELERPGLTFTWRLEQGDEGKPPALLVSKPREKDPQTFRRSKD
jgi:hypothetical protein